MVIVKQFMKLNFAINKEKLQNIFKKYIFPLLVKFDEEINDFPHFISKHILRTELLP